MHVEDNYFELFKEDGWELVDNKMGPWFIWRKPYEDEKPNIYTDTKSLIERNNRQIRTISFGVLITLILLYIVLINNFDNSKLISVTFNPVHGLLWILNSQIIDTIKN